MPSWSSLYHPVTAHKSLKSFTFTEAFHAHNWVKSSAVWSYPYSGTQFPSSSLSLGTYLELFHLHLFQRKLFWVSASHIKFITKTTHKFSDKITEWPHYCCRLYLGIRLSKYGCRASKHGNHLTYANTNIFPYSVLVICRFLRPCDFFSREVAVLAAWLICEAWFSRGNIGVAADQRVYTASCISPT